MHPTPKKKNIQMTEKLPTWRKWMYGSGDLGFSITSTIIGFSFLFFLTDVVGINIKIAGWAIFIGRTWDYINDPLFGYISDRTRTRWGRRRPFLLFGPIPYAIFFIMMWWKPPFQGEIALVVYFTIVYVFYDAAATMIYMPYFALTPELTSDYDERTSLTSVRAFFSLFGSLVAFTIPLLIVKNFSPENANNVLIMGLIFGITSAIPIWIVFLGSHERPEFMNQRQPGLRESIRASINNRPFLFSAAIYLFTWVSIDILQASILYFIIHVVNQENNNLIIMASIFVIAMFALPLWTWVSHRFNKRIAYIIGVAFLAAVLLVLVTLSPSTPMYFIIFLCILAGIGISAAHVMPWSIIPDTIEYDELNTGERHEGMFYSFISLSQKIASSFAILLVSQLLGATGYIQNGTQQPASAVMGIRIVMGPLPAFMLCIGIIFAILYPLGRERYTQIAQELEDRRVAAAAAEGSDL
jgi:GPH family glycoside/pentoside/hexuronide:cation symporter